MTLSPKQKQLIGQAAPTVKVEVEKSQLRRFAVAIGETDPIHLDEKAAQAAGYASIVATPTFIGSLTPGDIFLEELGWDFVSVMHRAEEYEYFRPICAGDMLTLTFAIADVYEQSAPTGGLIFLIVETRGVDGKNRPVFKARRVLVKLKG